MSDLETTFQLQLIGIYPDLSRALNSKPMYLLDMMAEFGAVVAVRKVLKDDNAANTLTTLRERNRLDLSVEAQVLKPEFASLFSDEERAKARKRLEDVEYTPPWLTTPSKSAPVATDNQSSSQPRAVDSTPPDAAPALNDQSQHAVETEAALIDDDEQDLLDEQTPGSITEWRGGIDPKHPLYQQFAVLYPKWLTEQYGEHFQFRPLSLTRYDIVIDGRPRRRVGRFRQDGGVYVWVGALTSFQLSRLRQSLSRPETLQDRNRFGIDGFRFVAYTDRDYQLLKELPIMLVTSRINRPDLVPFYAATERFVDAGLRHNGSLFTPDQAIWTLENIDDLYARFNQQIDLSQRDFLTKLRDQLTDAPSPTIQLMAEMLYVHLIITVGMKPATKRRQIEAVLEWLPEQAEMPPEIDAALNVGVSNAGVAFLIHKPYHLAFLIEFTQRWKKESADKREMMLGDPWAFKTFLFSVPMQTAYAQREALLHLVHPDVFEPIVSRDHKRQFAQQYSTLVSELTKDIDRQLRQIREQLTPHYGPGFDFYQIVPLPPEPSRLPAVWPRLATYRDFVQSLTGEPWSADALHAQAQTFGQEFNADADAEDLVLALRQLRLVRSAGPDRYTPQPYISGNALVPLMALGVLVLVEGTEDTFELPVRKILPRLLTATEPQPLDTFAPELGSDEPRLLEWYAEAGLLTSDGETWRTNGHVLRFPDGDPAADEYNRLRETLIHEHNNTLATEIAHADGALPASPDFAARLAELGRELLIDPAIVRRVYRSLLAGRHVVLSGPPGTGKTELAKRLPSLLWREEPQTITRLSLDIDSPPVIVENVARQGYAALLVTATEDWGVRDVVGGIAPRLDGANRTLGYEIQYGALTRALLAHYEGTDSGRRLPAFPHAPRRQDYRAENKRYRGAWLVIDEFTRAPVDAAFGSLLTTLGGGTDAMLRVPAADGGEVGLPLPADFRIIGTLNSFDRHFLNQISEAMKRRFDFIDVLPPAPRYEQAEHGIASAQALRRLVANDIGGIAVNDDPPRYTFEDVTVIPIEMDGVSRYKLDASGAATPALQSFWNIFRAIRVFRQLGTAQMVAVYTNLFAGRAIGMEWEEALDAALADSLADQLQVMTRDEQRILHAYVTAPVTFRDTLRTFAASTGAAQALLHTFGEAYVLRESTALNSTTLAALTGEQIGALFPSIPVHALPHPGVFAKRLRDLIGDRGL